MVDQPIWHQSLATIYTTLNAEQQKAVRRLLMQANKQNFFKHIRTITDNSNHLNNVLFGDAFIHQTDQQPDQQNALLDVLIHNTQQVGINSVYELLIDYIGRNQDWADELSALAHIQPLSDESQGHHSYTKDNLGDAAKTVQLFPGLLPEIMAELQRRKIEKTVVREVNPRSRKPFGRGGEGMH